MGLVGHSCRVLPSPTHIQEYLMDKLTNITQHSQPTMSSREIAELCDKEHRNVLADIRTMCEQLNLDVLTFQHIYLDSMNREQTLTADDQYDEKLNGLTRRSR